MKFYNAIGVSFFILAFVSASKCADDMNDEDINEFVLLPSHQLSQENWPENLSVCANASLLSYGNNDEAYGFLEGKGFNKVQEKEGENVDLSLRVEAWEDQEANLLIIAFRGPVFTRDTLPEIFLNKAVAHYAARCNLVPNMFSQGALADYMSGEQPATYLARHIQRCRDHWTEKKFISPDQNIDCFAPYLPETKFSQTLKSSGSATVGYGLLTGSIIAAGLPLTPVSASLVAVGAAYAASETIGGRRSEWQSIHHLMEVNKAALKIAEEYIGDRNNMKVIYTGHSLGGFIANTVAEASPKAPSSSLIFNAPGGVYTFIKEQKNHILDEQGWGTWLGKAFYHKANIDHQPRNITVNIARSHDMVGRAGGDDACRTSLLVADHNRDSATDITSYFYENHSMVNLARDLAGFKD